MQEENAVAEAQQSGAAAAAAAETARAEEAKTLLTSANTSKSIDLPIGLPKCNSNPA